MTTCPYCGRTGEVNERLRALGPGRTDVLPGDMMICPDCIRPSIFTVEGSLRVLTAAEHTPEVSRVVGAVETMIFGPFRA